MRLLPLALLASLSLPLQAADAPRAADPKAGKALHDSRCLACHGTEAYTREDRKIRSASALASRVSACSANTGAGWFPQEEADVAAYLNEAFYRFPARASAAPKAPKAPAR